MRLITETNDNKQPVIIVDPYETRSGVQIMRKLEKKEDVNVLLQKEFTFRLEHFFLIYAINIEADEQLLKRVHKSTRMILIFIRQPKKAKAMAGRIKREGYSQVKVVSLQRDYLDEPALERLLWFSFAPPTDESFLELIVHKRDDEPDPDAAKKMRKSRRFKRHYILGAVLTLAVYGAVTLAILLASSLMYINSFSSKARPGYYENANTARGLNGVGRALYRPVRPVFFFFSLGLLPDMLIDMNTQLDSLSRTHETIKNTSTSVARAVFIKQKNAPLKQDLSRQIDTLKEEIAKSIDMASSLEQKIPRWGNRAEEVRLAVSTQRDNLVKLQPVPQFLESILGKNSRRKYLLLLADTNSAKPGGGLMPFFGVLTMSDLDILSFELFDSRAVDLAREEPVEPTSAYRILTGDSDYTLQNSLLSSDFADNYRQITQLLARDAGMRDFDGGILLTDGGLAQIISAYSPVYVSELKDTITPENYPIKYQIAEDKKLFITALMNELQRKAPRTPSRQLVPALVQAFDEKQLVFLPQDPATADVFAKLYWSGKVPPPTCLIQSFVCTADYIFPIHTNIGDKPVNHLIEKKLSQRVFINPAGKITNTFTMKLQNASLAEVFPGGTYKSYAQIIVPATATLKKATINGTAVENPSVITSTYQVIGFPFELATQASKEIKVEYDLDQILPKTRSIYQLIFQKQIGSPNSDVALEIILPATASITNKNITGVVKNGSVFYNTVLDADKLFVLEIDNSK